MVSGGDEADDNEGAPMNITATINNLTNDYGLVVRRVLR